MNPSLQEVIDDLKYRGFTRLRTSSGVRPLNECSEYQLRALWRSGKLNRKGLTSGQQYKLPFADDSCR